MRWVGLDFHKRYITACALDDDGQVVAEHRRLPADVVPLVGWLQALGDAVTVAMEATLYWAWLPDQLSATGIAAVAAHPFRPQAGWRVLDAGCGDGRLLLSLARRGVRVVGADPSVAMLQAARDRARAAGLPVLLVRAEVGALPFGDEAFDASATVTVLCFMTDPVAALRKMARTVRRGGRLVIGELGRWSWWAVRRRREGRRRGGLWSVATFHSAGDLKRFLRAAGLVPRHLRGAVFYPRSDIASRLLAPLDPVLGAVTTVGAAFVAITAAKRTADGAPLADPAIGERGSNG